MMAKDGPMEMRYKPIDWDSLMAAPPARAMRLRREPAG